MRRRLSAWSRVFLVTVGTSAAALVAGVFVVERFPWPTVYTDFSLARSSQFLTPWPQPSMDEEQQDRKRLRRFAKQEVERRFGIQLRRMETLHMPLFDPFLDAGVQVGTSVSGTAPQPVLRFPWPAFETGRVIGDPGAQKTVSYFAIPMAHGVQLMEGVGVGVGEELRFSFPIVKNRRTLDFMALPLAPGTVRGTLGQYTWVRNFADSDVHRFQVISIPVNDSTASSLRITSQTAQFLLLGAVVSQWDRSGRVPVQVASQSALWETDPALMQAALAPGTESGAKEEGEGEGEAAAETPEQNPAEVPPPEVAAPVENDKDAAKRAGAKEALEKAKLPDPMEQVANPQVHGMAARTAALGYNILLLQLDEIPEDVVTNPDAYLKILPNLVGLLKTSVVSARGGAAAPSPLGVFHRTVLASGTDAVATENRVLLRKHLLGNNTFNLYARLRNFGYKVLAAAPARFLGLPSDLSAGREVPSLDRRWLGAADWPFAQRNKELEEQSQPATGLDAIFQTNTSPLAPPLTDADLERVGAFLAEVGRGERLFSDWRANETFLPDSEGLYLPSLVDFFQKWTKENMQSRFFVHAYVDTRVGVTRPSMKDLFQIAKARKFGALVSSGESSTLARLALLDRAVGQILSTLKVRRLTHRTAIGLLMPHGKEGSPRGLSAAISLPGVPVRGAPQSGTTVDDFVATLVTAVGVPLGRNVKDSVAAFPGASWELPKTDEGARGAQVEAAKRPLTRYVVYLRSGETGCEPLSWRTSEDVFGLESSQPVVEFSGEAGREHFRIFPCSLPGKMVRLSWFQTKHDSSESEDGGTGEEAGGAGTSNGLNETAAAPGAVDRGTLSDSPAAARNVSPTEAQGTTNGTLSARASDATALGGFFGIKREKDKLASATGGDSQLPLFFFGRNALRLGALPMTLSSLTAHEVTRLFDVDEREVPDVRLASDMLELSEFNRGAGGRSGRGAPGVKDEKDGGKLRSALLVFRHAVKPSDSDRLARAKDR